VNQINVVPDGVSGAGLDFNYASWSANTRITLTNVPWDNNYRDIVNFDSQEDLNDYIDGQEYTSTTLENVTYARPNRPVDLPIPFNAANRFNYLRASNPLQPVGLDQPKDYYYFITAVDYVAPNTTRIMVQLDVWQTYGYSVTFGNCYIERGHIGIANTHAFDHYGRDYLTIPEGLDVGGEMRTIQVTNDTIMDTTTFDILIVSTVSLENDFGTKDDPHLVAAAGDTFQGLPSGATYYAFDNVKQFQAFMGVMSNYPWIAQGIISITAVPDLARYGYIKHSLIVAPSLPNVAIYRIEALSGAGNAAMYRPNWRNDKDIVYWIPERYRGLKKFFTSPYMVIELTTFTGTATILKPEAWQDDNAYMNEKAVLSPPNQRIVITPLYYNTARSDHAVQKVVTKGHTTLNDDYGDYLEVSAQVSNFPTFAMVNNMGIAFLAANAHGIAQQYRSTDWSQARALGSNQTSYDQASNSMIASQRSAGVARGADTASTQQSQSTMGMQHIANAISTVGGAAIMPTPASAAGAGMALAGNAMSYGIDMQNSTAQLGIRNQANRAQNDISVNQTSYVRDTNKDLADWAARGDYAQSIGAINAKVQDAALIQPSQSGTAGGEAFNLVNGGIRVSLRWKLLGPAELRAVGEYWLRYGYAVRQFSTLPDSLRVMTKFTYWKLSETYISSARIPESFKQAIRGIFEKGVTVWTTPTDIGNIDIADNHPLPGIVLTTGVPDDDFDPTDPDTVEQVKEQDMPIILNVPDSSGNNFFAVGAEYLRWMNEEGITTPSQLLGPATTLNQAGAQQAFRLFGIDPRYVDTDTFASEWPDHVWSRALETEVFIKAAMQAAPTDPTDTTDPTTDPS
jgi:hypothetical protein